MMSHLNRRGGILALAFLLLAGTAAFCPDAAGADAVTVYEKGQARQVKANDPCFDSIIKNAVTLLAGSNDAYRMIVTPNLIESSKKSQRCIEVVFAGPRKIEVKGINEPFHISKIFIPLTGRFSQEHTTIFFADPEYGAVNQFINSIDTASRKGLEACVF